MVDVRGFNGVMMRGVAGWMLAACLSGCATSSYGPLSASGRPVPPETFQAAKQRVAEEGIPAPIETYFVAYYAEGRENRALHAMRAGLGAMRLGRSDLAARMFDEAILDVDTLHEGARQADRARSKFVREQEKWFKGESYERSALFFYRGLLYLAAQDFGNAAACFKRTQLYDVTGDDAPGFAGDWYSAEWALAFASYQQGFTEDAIRALERAAQFSTRCGDVPPPRPDHNVLLVIESGGGPIKYRTGQHGEIMRYRPGPNPADRIEVRVNNTLSVQSAAAERLYVQATTRGTRQVDHILAGKAIFKEGTGAAAHVFGLGAVVASRHRGREANIATGVLAGLAAISAIASASTTPEADIRTWNNLPAAVYLVGLRLPRGQSQLELKGFDAHGHVVHNENLTVEMDGHTSVKLILARM